MKIWNSGKTPAYNVSACFEDGTNIIIADTEKMPFEVLEPNKSFELRLIVHMGSANAFKIKTQWIDFQGKEQVKTQMGDI